MALDAGARTRQARTWLREAESALARGRRDEAGHRYAETLAALRGLDMRDHEVATMTVLALSGSGRVERESGNPVGALEPLERAVRLAAEIAPDTPLYVRALTSLGFAFRDGGRLDDAIAAFSGVLAVARAIDPFSEDVVVALKELSVLHRMHEELPVAERYAREAVALVDRIAPDGPAAAMSHLNLAMLLDGLGEPDEGEWEAAAFLLLRHGPEAPVTAASVDRWCEVMAAAARPEDAADRIGRVLAEVTSADSVVTGVLCLHRAATLMALGSAAADAEAMALLDHAHRTFTAHDGEHERIARTTALVAKLRYRGDGATAATLAAARQAVRDSPGGEALADVVALLAAVLSNLDTAARATNEALFALRELAEATAYTGRSPVEAARPIVDAWAAADPRSRHTAIALDNLGITARHHGDFAMASHYGRRALAVFRGLPDAHLDLAMCLDNLATTYLGSGDLGAAATLIDEERQLLAREAPRSSQMVACLAGLGVVRQQRGDIWGASIAFEQAVTLAEELGSRDRVWAQATVNLIGFELRQGEVADERMRSLRAAVDFFANAGSEHAVELIAALDVLAAAHLVREESDEVLAALRRSLQVGEAIAPGSSATALARMNMAVQLVRVGGSHDEALTHLDDAVAVMRATVPGSADLRDAVRFRGVLHHLDGRADAAIADLAEAVAITETLRVQAGESSAYRELVFADAQLPYRTLVDLLLDRGGAGDDLAAFRYMELCQARSLIDQLHGHDTEIAATTPEQVELMAELRDVESRLAVARAAQQQSPEEFVRRVGTAGDRMQEFANEYVRLVTSMPELRERLEALRLRRRELFPASAFLEPEPATPDSVRAQVVAAGRTAVVAYFLAGRALTVRAFDASGEMSVLRLEIDGRRLADDVAALTDPVQGSRRHAVAALAGRQEAAARLAATLLEPLPPDLWRDVEHLVIVPDAPLHRVPFEVLPTEDGRLVAERWATTYLPSLSVWDLVTRRTRNAHYRKDFAGFGSPLLPTAPEEPGDLGSWLSTRHRRLVPLAGTAEEIGRIAAQFGKSTTVRIGPDFTEHAVREYARGHRYVHFATHGVLDDDDPAFCGLVLSPSGQDAQPGDDSFLQAYEIPALGIAAEVVVCSACQTGLGAFRAGEGLVGLAQALLAGGARSVVLSLWPVPDVTTIRFMTAFYGALRAGRPVASALRDARAEVRRRHPDPYYWAPFIGIGPP